ncbi:hypothetical protein KC19_11G043700 [Ceratodon purpureus]|uniref:Uncharacterized protein n=1 Tax=Ceratodon purpureus TaxID=3225 RepID=A0A8T0GER2_CERPU|nr:hypothetical protein KC19_11G043700 [Ceratodon purpureus]
MLPSIHWHGTMSMIFVLLLQYSIQSRTVMLLLMLQLAALRAQFCCSTSTGKAQGCLECLEVARKVGWDVPKGVYDRLWFVLPLKRDRSLVFFNKCWCF